MNTVRRSPSVEEEQIRLERIQNRCAAIATETLVVEKGVAINPSLFLLELSWSGLSGCIDDSSNRGTLPVHESELLAVWKHPDTENVESRPINPNDLLALKIVSENIELSQAAEEGGCSVNYLGKILQEAEKNGLLIRASSRLKRPIDRFPGVFPEHEKYRTASVFTLQWHITQACDLHCRHCYDRSERAAVSLDQGLKVLNQMQVFCKNFNVQGQITFTGGNPLLHHNFLELYQAAADKGFLLAVLGNVTSAANLDKIIAIHPPEYYQVSLEGLRNHNDIIRGAGYFDRVFKFLQILREKKIYSMVMLTLTAENVDQVLPLAALLQGKANLFMFNRLTLFGEGAGVQPVPVARYAEFLREYARAEKDYSVLAFKDSLFTPLCFSEEHHIFGGCAGFGCGAAFNFMALLPDGEVHACRKFPSLLGNLHSNTLEEIYSSPLAQSYRRGSDACVDCAFMMTCRGCPGVTAGHHLNPFTERDPYCPGPVSKEFFP